MADEDLIGVSVAWQGMTKRLWLSGPTGDDAKESLKQAFVALDEEGDEAGDWREFLDVAIGVFKRHGFTWVDN